MEISSIKSLYAAFDVYPSCKGAATHISAFSEVLFRQVNPGMLYAIGPNAAPEEHSNHILVHFNQSIKNYLHRARQFTTSLYETIEDLEHLEVCHYRDIWSGLAVIHADVNCPKIFEVNGLPSIELKYRYPQVSEATIRKIAGIERSCLAHSNIIITPSCSTRDFLVSNGVQPDKVIVIPNGADIPGIVRKPDITSPYLMYFGALQPWQGVDVLLKAFAHLQDIDNLKLLICSSQHRKFSKSYIKLAEKLGINERLIWQHQLDKTTLNRYLQHAVATIAPLKSCDRNIRQGCAPLKILESMAASTMVIASDLPPVKELITHNENGVLVRADRPATLARHIRVMLEYPDVRKKLACNGRQTIEEKFQWQQQKTRLQQIYQSIYAY